MKSDVCEDPLVVWIGGGCKIMQKTVVVHNYADSLGE